MSKRPSPAPLLACCLLASCATAPVARAPVPAPALREVTPAAPPAPPRPTLEVGEVSAEAAPLLFTYAAEPDVARITTPLVSREARARWAAYDAARREVDAPLRAPRITVREPLCGDDGVRPVPPDPVGLDAEGRDPSGSIAEASMREPSPRAMPAFVRARAALVRELEHAIGLAGAPERGAAPRVLLAFVEEAPPVALEAEDPEDTARRRGRAVALYRDVTSALSVDAPMGFLARYRLAGLAPPKERAAAYDALLDVSLASPAARDWVRPLTARPLGDWSKAAGVLRAVTLTASIPAATPPPTAATRIALRTEWLVATYNAASARETLDLATTLLREPAYPHIALDMAARAIARSGEVGPAVDRLPPAAYATLLHHVASIALGERDLAMATRAAERVIARAPESAEAPASVAVLAACLALRGDRASAEALAASSRARYAPQSPWAEALRARRAPSDGYPSDAQIESLSGALSAPLPEAPANDEERVAASRKRVSALAQRCFAHPRDAALDDDARVDLTVLTYGDRPPAVTARAEGDAALLAPALACIRATGPSLFVDAGASVHATIRVVRATEAP